MDKYPQYNTKLKGQEWNYDPNDKLIDQSINGKSQKSQKNSVYF